LAGSNSREAGLPNSLQPKRAVNTIQLDQVVCPTENKAREIKCVE
jgi:hypothetical protein